METPQKEQISGAVYANFAQQGAPVWQGNLTFQMICNVLPQRDIKDLTTQL